MDKSLKTVMRTFRSTRFRTPLRAEKDIGLWVDRVGISVDRNVKPDVERLRVLGLYAAVGIERGDGNHYSRATGEVAVPHGSAIIVFPEMPHRYRPHERWQTRFVVWGGLEADTLVELGFLDRKRPVIPDGAAAVCEANHRLGQIMHAESLEAILERKAILLQMLLDLHRHRRAASERTGAASAMAKALSWMRAHHADPGVSVPACAAAAGLSISHFRRLFHAHTGRSPKDFLTSLRMSSAKDLLSRGAAIKEVAAAVGYDDPCHFMRQFKAATGRTPGEFRAAQAATNG